MNRVLIIGAGPAGVAAAIRAHQYGLNVEIVEIMDEKDEKVCGDGLTESAVRALRSLEILPEDLIAAGANEIRCSLRLYPIRRNTLLHERMSCFTLRRISLMKLLRTRALSLGIKIRYRTAYRPDMQADFLVDASGCRKKAITEGLRYPMGLSSVITAETELSTDTLYFAYPEEGSDRYGWAFPLCGGMWNVGVWDPIDPKRLRSSFEEFKRTYLERFLHGISIVRPLRGAYLGTLRPLTPIHPGAISCGDAAGLCSHFSGEGISYALQSGIQVAEQIHSALLEFHTTPERRNPCVFFKY